MLLTVTVLTSDSTCGSVCVRNRFTKTLNRYMFVHANYRIPLCQSKRQVVFLVISFALLFFCSVFLIVSIERQRNTAENDESVESIDFIVRGTNNNDFNCFYSILFALIHTLVTTQSTLGASLQCPVCYEMFGTRIYQCCQGHSVCERCYGKISNTQCPQCRSNYMGTRNYMLEKMIESLKMLKNGSNGTATAVKTNDDDKLTNEIAKLVQLIPTADETISPIIPPFNTQLTTAAVHHHMDAIIDEIQGSVGSARLPQSNVTSQPAGLFNCRMQACTERLPICRMWNHIRTFHVDHFTEASAVDENFVTHFSFPYDTYRRALHIPRFGLFFFIVNVKKEGRFNTITAWVQVVGRREECRRFSYELNLRIGNRIATYKDAVSSNRMGSAFVASHEYINSNLQTYGDWTDTNHIEAEEECLLIKTNQVNTTRFKEIDVDLSVKKLAIASRGPRSSETNIEASLYPQHSSADDSDHINVLIFHCISGCFHKWPTTIKHVIIW